MAENKPWMGIPPHGTEGDTICGDYPPWGFLSLDILPFAAKLGPSMEHPGRSYYLSGIHHVPLFSFHLNANIWEMPSVEGTMLSSTPEYIHLLRPEAALDILFLIVRQ